MRNRQTPRKDRREKERRGERERKKGGGGRAFTEDLEKTNRIM